MSRRKDTSIKGVPFLSNVFPVIHHKLFGEHHEYLLIDSTVYVVFPFQFLPMLHGSCLYQVIVNHGQERFALYCVIFLFFLYFGLVFPVSSFILTCNIVAPFWTNISPFFFILRGSVCYNGTNTSPLLNCTMGTQYKTNKRRLENGTFRKEKRSERTKTD